MSNQTKTLGNRQFSLGAALTTVTTVAILIAICVRIPRATFVQALRTAPVSLAFSILYALVPLSCVTLVCLGAGHVMRRRSADADRSRGLRFFTPHRLLWQVCGSTAPSFGIALLIASACTLVLPLLWPFMREFGLGVSLMINHGFTQARPILSEIPALMCDRKFVWRLLRWESFSLIRWWILFGSMATLWVVANRPFQQRFHIESATQCYLRLLSFAPWLVVLETAFLVGVWTQSPNTVPEPSTGFVEGVFAWNLWHWDCWYGVVWINRGFVPTFAVAAVFFRYVLRWWWRFAIAAAACVIPVALLLSVAWTVLYGQLFY